MGKYPSANQAGVYFSTLAFLRAVSETGDDQSKDAVSAMKGLWTTIGHLHQLRQLLRRVRIRRYPSENRSPEPP